MRRATVAPVVEAAVAAVSSMENGEVILVANGPAEGRRELGFRSPRLRLIECRVPRQSAARNLGLREAENDVVLFTDDDCLLAPEWPQHLARRLRGGDLAVATPLEMRRDGPVTTFLDYQRIFHPQPIDASTADYGLGASIGIRRDLVGSSFDAEMGPGDDVQFGRSLRDAGISTAYVTEAPPPIHLLPERLESLTGRFIRYGTSNAVLFLRKDRSAFSIPHATSLYSSLCRNDLATPRRFEEVADPDLRTMFALYELILLGCFLVGYLGRAGEILGREIIRVDDAALAEGWRRIERKLVGALDEDRDWERLPIDHALWLTPRHGKRPAFAAEVGENLTRNAALTEQPRLDPELDQCADEMARRADEVWLSANEILGELRDGQLVAQTDPIAWRLREVGVAFREGAQMIETIALGPVEPEAVATAG